MINRSKRLLFKSNITWGQYNMQAVSYWWDNRRWTSERLEIVIKHGSSEQKIISPSITTSHYDSLPLRKWGEDQGDIGKQSAKREKTSKDEAWEANNFSRENFSQKEISDERVFCRDQNEAEKLSRRRLTQNICGWLKFTTTTSKRNYDPKL